MEYLLGALIIGCLGFSARGDRLLQEAYDYWDEIEYEEQRKARLEKEPKP
jgi:hypothetical protein